MSLETQPSSTAENRVVNGEFQELSPRRALRLLSRGLRLRCPNCGLGRIRGGWLKLKPKCPVCGLRTDRGEEDFFLGGMMWNIVFAEGALVVSSLLIGFITWPDVPWNGLMWGLILAMIPGPILFYPFAKCLWLAVDLTFRPLTLRDLEGHGENLDSQAAVGEKDGDPRPGTGRREGH